MLGQDIIQSAGAQNIACAIEVDALRLNPNQVTAVSLLLAELITRSLKHAFRERVDGALRIRLETLGSGRIALVYADDRPGMPPAIEAKNVGLGIGIIRAFASQRGGALVFPGPGSSETRPVFDLWRTTPLHPVPAARKRGVRSPLPKSGLTGRRCGNTKNAF